MTQIVDELVLSLKLDADAFTTGLMDSVTKSLIHNWNHANMSLKWAENARDQAKADLDAAEVKIGQLREMVAEFDAAIVERQGKKHTAN